MNNNDKIQEFIDKAKKMERGVKLDLSSGEDLSIGIMNLISIEEHLFFSAGKTGKTHYYDLLDQVRRMRVELMKKLVKDYNGEVWCISKHLLAASMRVMEVGTKALKNGEREKAEDLFKKSYDLYNLFWGLNLGIVKKGEMKDIKQEKQEKSINIPEKTFLGKISDTIGKMLDCCRE